MYTDVRLPVSVLVRTAAGRARVLFVIAGSSRGRGMLLNFLSRPLDEFWLGHR